MKAIAILMALMLIPSLLTGCGVYGKGETIGYIYAVDDAVLWTQVWYKSSLESSESDCYVVDTDKTDLIEKLKQASGETKVKMKYEKHLYTLNLCPTEHQTHDAIVDVQIIE